MPSGMAAEMRAALQTWDRSGLVPERSNKSTTGFTNVIKVKGKFQACLAMVVVESGSGSRCTFPVFSTLPRMPQFIWPRSRKGCARLGSPPPKPLIRLSLRTKSTSPASRWRSSQLRHQRCPCLLWSHLSLWCGYANSVYHASYAVRGSLAASDAAASLRTTVWLILICICYVTVYVQTEDNPILCP